MKYADCVGDTDRNRGGSKTLTGMLLNQINGLKLLHTSSSQCSGHHVQLRNHCIVGVEFFPTSSHEVTIGTILKKKEGPACSGNDMLISLLPVTNDLQQFCYGC